MTVKDLLLLKLGEEGSEVSQAVSKMLHFGGEDRYPEDTSTTCSQRLAAELNDIVAVARYLAQTGILPEWEDLEAQRRKVLKVCHYLRVAHSRGRVDDPENLP